MNKFRLVPSIGLVNLVPGLTTPLTVEQLAAEPSLFSNDWESARKNAGPIVQKMLDSLEGNEDIAKAKAAGLHEVIDVRVQRLMPGMYPSIPGWHCDSVPRKDYHSQPDFSLINPDSVHFTCIASTARDGVSATQFMISAIDFEFDDKLPVWQQLHRQIEAEKDAKNYLSFYVNNGHMMRFSTPTAHRTSPTTTRGWRAFFRLSMYHNPPVANAITNQQQVYILSEDNGW